uniref:Uncharacterized protein n=1 Tax=Arcella intermedia TaxID=1963864 RepID=A0A6B2LJQ1_9EUKA
MVKFVSSTGNRDKLTKFLQFEARFLVYFMKGRQNELAERLDKFYKATGDARRILRFFNEFNTVGVLARMNPSKMNVVDWLGVLSNVTLSMFLVIDHLLWLLTKGVFKGDLEKWKKIGNYLWLISLLASIIQNTIVYRSTLAKGAKKEDKMKCLLTYIRVVPDVFSALEGLNKIQWSDAVMGSLGMISSAEGIYSGWSAK